MSLPPSPHPRGFATVSRCPLCAAAIDPLEAKVLSETGERTLVHVLCRSCGHAVLALVVLGDSGMFSVGLVTDCSSEDAVRFREAAAVSADDVLAARAALADGRSWLRALQP